MKSLPQFINESALGMNGFVILKPKFTEYDEMLSNKLKLNGWTITHKKKQRLTKDVAKELYAMLADKPFYNDLCDYMVCDDCICYGCHKDTEDPIKEMNDLKGEIRKAIGKNDMENGMHSSDSLDNVQREYDLCMK